MKNMYGLYRPAGAGTAGEEARTLWPTTARTNFLRAPRLTRSRAVRADAKIAVAVAALIVAAVALNALGFVWARRQKWPRSSR